MTKRGLDVIALTSVAFFMVTLDSLVVVTALPVIHADLGGGPDRLQWVVAGYNLTFAAAIITAATLGDRIGRRRLYAAGLLLFTVASAACALAQDIDALIAFRVLQGMGAAIITPLGLTLLSRAFPPERRGSVVGIWGGIAGLGVATGPLVGGAVTEGLDWHWVFWVNVPVGVAALAGCLVRVPESRGPSERLDLTGMLLATTGVTGLIWGLVRGPESGWGSAETVAALVGGVVLGVAFLLWEARTVHPMVPLSLFRSRAFASSVTSGLLMTASIFSAAYLTSELFQLGHGLSPWSTGVRFLPWTLTPLVVAPIAGRLFDRWGARRLAGPGLALQATGFVWLGGLATTDAGYAAYVAPFILAGVGVSLALPSLPAAALNAVPPDLLGRGAGVLNSLQRLGSALGIAVVTVVFASVGSLRDPGEIAAGYRGAILTAAAISAVGALCTLGLRGPVGEPRPRPEADPAVVTLPPASR